MNVRAPVGWLRRHPLVADSLLVALILLLALPEVAGSTLFAARFRRPNALDVAIVLLEICPLVFRRRVPHAVLAITAAALFAQGAFGFPPTFGLIGVAIAVFTVALLPARRLSTGAAAVLAAAVLSAPFLHQGHLNGDDFGSGLFVLGLPWLFGDMRRTRKVHLIALEEQAERAERERADEARRAVAAERARLARELHDVVAHAVSVTVVQAHAADRLLPLHPEAAAEHVAAIEITGRQAMAELRRLLDVLRDDGGVEGLLTPQPGVADLDSLLEQVREAGLPVELVVEGHARPLPASLDLSVYRIVQEALTNTLRHAGPARARVRLRYGPDALEVAVTDDGLGAAEARNGSGGHGLAGMRERVALFGGTLRAGERPEAGYEVSVGLPLEPISR